MALPAWVTYGLRPRAGNFQRKVSGWINAPSTGGGTEYIKDLRGKEHHVRKWNGRSYTYTRLGRTYFDANKGKFVVEVHVRIEGKRGAGRDHRRDGEPYERRAMMPVSHFGEDETSLSERLTDAEKEIRIKKLVLDSVGSQRRRCGSAATPGVQ